MPMPVPLPKVLTNRYTIERELGRGGMGTVYLAYDAKNHRQVALKMLRRDLSLAIGRARFLREIDIAARLNHPHILPLHDSDEADGALYYVMPYVEGESLHEKLDREKQLPVQEAIRIAHQVAGALAYAHARGVVHRDIKPANIMLQGDQARVADFGIALLAQPQSSDRLTETGQSPGTPLYMSPEQFLADRAVDGRTDIYSLGCVLYEMLCGEPPYTGNSYQSVMAKKLYEPAPHVCTIRETVSPALERVTHKALCKNPADRFQTAAEFAQALEAATTQQAQAGWRGFYQPPEDALRQIPPPPPRRLSVSKTLAYGTGILAVLTAIGFLTVTVYDQTMRIPAELRPSRFNFPGIGAQTLVPGLVKAFMIVIGYMLVKYLVRFAMLGLRRIPRTTSSLASWQMRVSNGWHNFWSSTSPSTVAELYLLISIVVSLIVLVLFDTLLAAIWNQKTDLLSNCFHYMHFRYTWALTALITALIFAWRSVQRYLQRRAATGGSYTLARWGGLAWILILIMIMSAPWLLLWGNDRPMVELNGKPGFILVKRANSLVIYRPDEKTTEYYDREPLGLKRLSKAPSYVFQSARCP